MPWQHGDPIHARRAVIAGQRAQRRLQADRRGLFGQLRGACAEMLIVLALWVDFRAAYGLCEDLTYIRRGH